MDIRDLNSFKIFFVAEDEIQMLSIAPCYTYSLLVNLKCLFPIPAL